MNIFSADYETVGILPLRFLRGPGVRRPRMGRGRHLSRGAKKGDKAEVTFLKGLALDLASKEIV